MCITAAGVVWFINPSAGVWPVFLIILGMCLLLAFRIPIWRGSIYDWAILLFLATAALSVWSGYDQSSAWSKFFILVAAVCLFWAVRSQALNNYWLVAGIIAAWSALIAGHFLLVQDWSVYPGDLPLINRLGQTWAAARPEVPLRSIHPNIAGGLLAALLPLQIFALAYARRRGRSTLTYLLAGTALFSGFALLMTSSRAAWSALLVSAGLWLVWSITRFIEKSASLSRRSLLRVLLVVSGLALIVLAANIPDDLIQVLDRLPGQQSAASRLSLYRSSLYLIQDYPLIGGGLAAFPGLFSEYILVSPFFFFGYAHNLFIDVVIEQGILGLVAVALLLIGSLLQVAGGLWRSRHPSRRVISLRWGAFTGLVVILLHGLLDDSFYGMAGTPLLFLIPALAIASTSLITPTRSESPGKHSIRRTDWRGVAALLVTTILLLAGIMYATRGFSPSAILANLGAVRMSKSALTGWPTGKWDDGSNPHKYDSAEDMLLESIRIYPLEETALYRMGLVSVSERDFQAAKEYLEKALSLNPNHPGISKSLGFTYVWLGEYQEAMALLSHMDGNMKELAVYQSWWLGQGRDDLSERASIMLDLMNTGRSRPSSTQ